jgi:ribosomal protein S18 acetylase RimI-like enzyme
VREDVVVKVIRKADRGEVARLYIEAGWMKPEEATDLSLIDRIVSGSFCFVGAFHGNRMIGMGRSISDGICDAYIQDVTVLKEFRGRGVGRSIMSEILKYLRTHRLSWIGLLAEPGTRSLYEKLGFVELAHYTPMLWREDD